MSSYDDGGPALPTREDSTAPCRGMSLRDYFAASIVQGLCANPGGPFQANAMSGWNLTNCDDADVCGVAYRMADAMLAARTPAAADGSTEKKEE